MGKKSEDEASSHVGGDVKDSRRAKKREEEARSHHNWYERSGPGLLIRSRAGEATRTSFEAEDAFDISCDDVAHSINKGKRWEKIQRAHDLLAHERSAGKISLVKTELPGTVGKHLMWTTGREIDQAGLIANRGGVRSLVEIEGTEVRVREAKSDRASLASLKSTAGPGPLMKKNRHRARGAKRGEEKEEEGTMSDPSEEKDHTVYSTLELRKNGPKEVERAWRWAQNRSTGNKGYARKPAADFLLDWYSEQQEDLEYELDEYYEEQLESELPLKLPQNKKRTEEEREAPAKEEEEKEDEFPLRETKQARRSKRARNQAEQEAADYRDNFVELRAPLSSATHLEGIFPRAKEWFANMRGGECLSVFPRTAIIHKDHSEQVLGTKMRSCTFVAASSSVAGEVQLYSAPKFCCTPGERVARQEGGWQSHARNERDHIEVVEREPVVASTSECSICKKSEEEKEEEGSDTVIVQHARLISLSCGHLACSSCWLLQAKHNARARSTAVTCVNPHCSYVASVTEMAAIFSDGTLFLFRDFWWDSLFEKEGALPCYACPRLLVPGASTYPSAGLCVCGARTCKKCGLREHLPLACRPYERWARMAMREGIAEPKKPYVRNPVRHLTPSEMKCLKDCWRCGAEGTLTWKNWCDSCCHHIALRFEDPIDTRDKLIEVLQARGRMMNGEYRQARIDRRLIDKKKSLAMEKIVEEGVFLFELIKITRLLGGERALRRKIEKIARQRMEVTENLLERVLFAALETGGDPNKKSAHLEQRITAIRQDYAQFM